MKSILRVLIAGSVFAVALSVMAPREAEARWWRHHHGSWGSHGSHGSHGSWGSYGSYGSHGGWYAHRRHHRVYYHGSWGSYGSAGYWHSCGSSGGVYSYPAPSESAPAGELPAAPESAARGSGEATLTVSVPEAAKVYVNGVLTKSTGDQRHYVSRGLSPGYRYTYEVRAEVERDGRTVEDTKVVQLRAGQSDSLAFAFADAQPPDTSLTLHVPAAAKVVLAGRETAADGPVRVFRTSKLGAGETWSDYRIEVSLERDGRTLTQERTITLTAGESQTQSFTFDAPQVASVR